jgi:hypothetical protein
MPRLIVNPGTSAEWEIPLGRGTMPLGRGPENLFPITHDSISNSHCEITTDEFGTMIRDLASSNGTFVNGHRIAEAVLEEGQTIRLGDVELRYESDGGAAAPPLAPPMPVSRSAVISSAARCRCHPQSPAAFKCPKCGLYFCELCVSSRRERGRMGKFCRSCSVECLPVTPARLETQPTEQSFAASVLSAFSFPFKGDGAILLVAGAIFLLVLDAAKYLAQFALIFGLVAYLILSVFGTGYLLSYLRRILTASAGGENKLPDWPDFTEMWSDVVLPFLQFLGTVLFCFAPAIALAIFVPTDSPWRGWGIFASILLGCVYFPMAFTAVAMFDTVTAVNPLLIIPSILKIPVEYLFTILLFALVLLVRWLFSTFLPSLVHLRILCWIIGGFLGLYLYIVEMRVLGLVYWWKKNELGWFSR